MRRICLLLPLVVGLVASGEGRKPLVGGKVQTGVNVDAEVPLPLPESPVSVVAAKPEAPDEDLPNLKFGEVKSPALRLLLEEWRVEKAIELQKTRPTAKYEVTGIDQEGDVLVVSERVSEKGTCAEGPRRLVVEQRTVPAKVLEDELIGHDCCDGACANRPPVGWLLKYSQLVQAKAAAGFRALVDPAGKLELAVSYGGARTDEETVKRTGFSREELDAEAVGKFTALDLARAKVSCQASFDDKGKAACTVSSPSLEARYEWRKSGDSVFLTAVSEAH